MLTKNNKFTMCIVLICVRKGDLMVELQWVVEGRRFRSPEEYQAALRDKKLIDSITGNLKLDNFKNIETVYNRLKSGGYRFETVVGRQFDDNIYELYKRLQQEEKLKAEEKQNRQKRKKEKVKKAIAVVKKSGEIDSKTKFEDLDKKMQYEVLKILKKRERKRRVMVTCCILLCLMCFGYFGAYYNAAAKSTKEFEELAALKDAEVPLSATQEQAYKVNLTSTDVKIPDILSEYQAVYAKNKKVIGWIKIDDTPIDYPVMQTTDNEYYLNHDLNQKEDKNGCIFMDYQCDVVKGCDNIILYGHHMKSGKMFGSLNKYSQKSYFEKHRYIDFDTIYKKGKYEVMYVFRSKVYSEEDVNFKYYQFIDAGSSKEFDSYMNEMAEASLYDTGVTASYGDELLTLSTCDYQQKKGRFVVVAKRIS